jgi:hypothetical protein
MVDHACGGDDVIETRFATPSIVKPTIGSRRSRGDELKLPDPLRNHD